MKNITILTGFWSDPNELGLPTYGSLESHFGQTDFDNAFVSIKATEKIDIWLLKAMLGRPLGYAQMEAVWPRHIDGFVFNRTMAPSTPIPGNHVSLYKDATIHAWP